MPIANLRIMNFRNLAAVDFKPTVLGINLISGCNGSGKTSLLEAIYYLGLGRSFRSHSPLRLIKQNTEGFSLYSQIVSGSETQMSVGIERHIDGFTRMKIAEKETKTISELAFSLPIRVINSHSHDLFESGPAHRRKYLDWGLFYHSERFLPCWRQFERVLKQRNTILKNKGAKKELASWTAELVKHHLQFDSLRREYIQILTSTIPMIARQLLDINLENLTITYLPGWDDSKSYEVVVEEALMDDYRLGHTQFGAHRADIEIKIDGVAAKHFLSRGQQKLLICAMILAQGMLLGKQNKNPIYLVDDLPSELDNVSREKLLFLLAEQPSQVFITAIDDEPIYKFLNDVLNKPVKVFHVEHGNVTEMAMSASNLRSIESGYEYS